MLGVAALSLEPLEIRRFPLRSAIKANIGPSCPSLVRRDNNSTWIPCRYMTRPCMNLLRSIHVLRIAL